MIAKITKLGDKVAKPGKQDGQTFNVREITVEKDGHSKTYDTAGKAADALDAFKEGDLLEFEQTPNENPAYKPKMTNPRKPGEAIEQKKGWGGGGKQDHPETMLVSYCKDLVVAGQTPDDAESMVAKWYTRFKEITK